ncbi:MAG: anaerobic ribonucleoside-triphosphate reductase activating protein [Bacillota bacterium]
MSSTQNAEKINIRIAGVVRESVVDGPGLRYVIFAQGCPHRCPDCHNPETWDPDAGYESSLEVLVADIVRNPLLKGVTFSGGDPFLQAASFAALGWVLRGKGYDITTYTGYTFEELVKGNVPSTRELLAVTDVLVDGPFVLAERDLTLPFRGSRNQRLIDVQASMKSGGIIETKLRRLLQNYA